MKDLIQEIKILIAKAVTGTSVIAVWFDWVNDFIGFVIMVGGGVGTYLLVKARLRNLNIESQIKEIELEEKKKQNGIS